MTALVGGYVPNFSHVVCRVFLSGGAHLFHCTFWFVGTSSFCWRSSCFGLGWVGSFTRSFLWAVAGAPSPLLGYRSCVSGFPSLICFNLINGHSRGQNIPQWVCDYFVCQQTELTQSKTPPTSITFVICKGTWSIKSIISVRKRLLNCLIPLITTSNALRSHNQYGAILWSGCKHLETFAVDLLREGFENFAWLSF